MLATHGSDRETILATIGRWEQAQAGMAELSFDVLTATEALAIKGRLETGYRRQAAVDHRLTYQLTSQGSRRTRRTASPAQRIMLHAKDPGCTRPGCTASGCRCQVHHAVDDWADGGQTNIDDLTLACPKDNRLVKPGGWKTRKRSDGRTEWIPPPHLDSGQSRVNDCHHPENLLLPKDDEVD